MRQASGGMGCAGGKLHLFQAAQLKGYRHITALHRAASLVVVKLPLLGGLVIRQAKRPFRSQHSLWGCETTKVIQLVLEESVPTCTTHNGMLQTINDKQLLGITSPYRTGSGSITNCAPSTGDQTPEVAPCCLTAANKGSALHAGSERAW